MTQEPKSDLVLYDIFSEEENQEDTTSAPEDEAVSSAVAETQPQEEVRRPHYELDPNDLYGSFRALFEGDPHFRNVAKSFLGRERRSELQRRIAELEAELARERYERYQGLVSSIPEEQLEEAVTSNPELKEAVDYIQHYDPSLDSDIGVDVSVAIEEAFESAEDWIPSQRLAQYREMMAPGGCKCSALDWEHGIFDHDPSGNQLSVLRSFQYFKSMLDSEVQFAQQAWQNANAARAQVQQQQPAPYSMQGIQPAQQPLQPPAQVTRATVAQSVSQLRNPKLNANPDLSGGAINTDFSPITKEDIDRMSIEEMIRRWPNDGDFERDVLAGKIIIPGLNS